MGPKEGPGGGKGMRGLGRQQQLSSSSSSKRPHLGHPGSSLYGRWSS